MAWKAFLDHPIIGVGPANIPWNIGKYQPPEDLKYRRGVSGMAVHSLYFTLIPELGLVGTFFFTTMLYYYYKNTKFILKKEKEVSQLQKIRDKSNDKNLLTEQLRKFKFIIFGINGALLGYLVSGVFLSVFYYPHFWFLIAINVSAYNVFKNYKILKQW